jgi:UDP-N-acetylglucosamine 1-carboxyvinyltransferase
MSTLAIEGGERLSGEVNISGSKNCSLALLAGALLSDGPQRIANVPDVQDVECMLDLLKHMGLGVNYTRRHFVDIDMHSFARAEAPYRFSRRMRAGILVMGSLLARHEYAQVACPGGDTVGPSPVDMHLSSLQQMGAKVKLSHGVIELRAKRLKGASILFERPSVTCTESLMMAATLAQGTTVLHNCACEPEVVGLSQALNRMGAFIDGAGSETITIEGVDALAAMEHTVCGDRIECGILMIASAMTHGDICIYGCDPAHVTMVCQVLRAIGAEVNPSPNQIVVKGPRKPRAVNLTAQPFPGFPADLKAPLTALLSISEGDSIIRDSVFEHRVSHIGELIRMGAQIKNESNSSFIKGVRKIEGAELTCLDDNVATALLLAALAAEGTTTIYEAQHLERAYSHLDLKLARLGGRITRLDGEERSTDDDITLPDSKPGAP